MFNVRPGKEAEAEEMQFEWREENTDDNIPQKKGKNSQTKIGKIIRTTTQQQRREMAARALTKCWMIKPTYKGLMGAESKLGNDQMV